MDKEIVIAKLLVFKKEDKFSPERWKARGVNSSDGAVCNQLAGLFDETADQLLRAVNQNPSSNIIKKT